jgi:hypothetical protein
MRKLLCRHEDTSKGRQSAWFLVLHMGTMRVRLAPCVRVRLWSLRRNRHSQQEKHPERGCDCGFCFCTERTEGGNVGVDRRQSRRWLAVADVHMLRIVTCSVQSPSLTTCSSPFTQTLAQTHARTHTGGSPLALFVLEGNNVAKMFKSVATG